MNRDIRSVPGRILVSVGMAAFIAGIVVILTVSSTIGLILLCVAIADIVILGVVYPKSQRRRQSS
jgi:hypothetical protein